MRYRDFIEEITQLADEAQAIALSDATHEDARFRNWRHKVESLVNEVEAIGYRLPGKFRSGQRAYRAMSYYASADEDAEAFRKELGDSERELRHLAEHFRKYGEPSLAQLASSSGSSLTYPEKITIAWLFQHVPVRLWISAIGALIVAFLIGAQVGNTEAYRSLTTWIASLSGDQQ